MRLLCGVDLVQISRLQKLYERQGAEGLKRIFTSQELALFCPYEDNMPSLAARFAAKEALAKAFGTGLGEHCQLQEIKVLKDDLGAPYYELSGQTKAYASSLAVVELSLSLAHEADLAVAFCVLSLAK